MATFGERLKELRHLKSLKQSDISELLNLKDRIIIYYEKDERTPPLDKLIILADYFDVSLDYLTGRSDHMDGLTPIALRAREKALLEKLPPHLAIQYRHAKNDQSLSELKSVIENFEKISKQKNPEHSLISKVLEKFQKKEKEG